MKTNINVPAKGTVTIDATNDPLVKHSTHEAAPQQTLTLARLVTERKDFEATVYRTSNERLYALLSQCQAYVESMQRSDKAGDICRAELRRFITDNNVRVSEWTDAIGRVLRC